MNYSDFTRFAEFQDHESQVRYYCRRMPRIFSKAKNAKVWDENGEVFIDFLSACGSLNYGHNHPRLKKLVVDYLSADGIINSLDLHTIAKENFIRSFRHHILEPRGLNYRLQFTGPTGANAVEASFKLARKVTGRRTIAAFTNGFHGVTLGALAATGNSGARRSCAGLLDAVVRLPFEGYSDAGIGDLERFEAMAADPSGGVEPPAAFIVETVQGEGGLNVASVAWLRSLSALAKRLGSLLIVDDVQAGCGRTGRFFSFDRAGINPDIVCLSKSLSGIGLPMALVLLRPDLDIWNPGEHNGTFRGNNLAFVAAAEACALWSDSEFTESLLFQTTTIERSLRNIVDNHPALSLRIKGTGLMTGIAFADPAMADRAAEECFSRRVLIETAGPHDEVLKIMPPLTIEYDVLKEGLDRISEAVTAIAKPIVSKAA